MPSKLKFFRALSRWTYHFKWRSNKKKISTSLLVIIPWIIQVLYSIQNWIWTNDTPVLTEYVRLYVIITFEQIFIYLLEARHMIFIRKNWGVLNFKYVIQAVSRGFLKPEASFQLTWRRHTLPPPTDCIRVRKA